MKKLMIKLFQISSIMGIALLFLVMSIGYTGYVQKVKVMPLEEKIESIRENENYVQGAKIDEDFLDAIVAVEDRRFYEHGAIDGISLLRATLSNVKAGRIVQGGSTITQQLAKNLYFTGEKTMMRKVEEMFVAYEIEKNYTKEEVLELYVNIIYYGDGHYGIKEACEGYFNKQPHELSFDEATLLAGLPQAPSRYALSTNYQAAKKRQIQVIASLNDYIRAF